MAGFDFGQFAGNGGLGDMIGAGLTAYGMSDYHNPAGAANPYFNQIQQQLPGYFQPYMNAGSASLPILQQQYGQLLNNPAGLMNRIGSTFQASPGYKWQVGQAEDAVNNAASAGGMLGSPQEQQQMAQTVGNLANQNYYNYLNQGMGAYGMGLQGMGNLANLGYRASSSLGEDLANALMSQASLAYAGQQNQNEEEQGGLGGLGGLISGGLSAAGMSGLF